MYSKNKLLDHLMYSLDKFFSVFSQFTAPCAIMLNVCVAGLKKKSIHTKQYAVDAAAVVNR